MSEKEKIYGIVCGASKKDKMFFLYASLDCAKDIAFKIEYLKGTNYLHYEFAKGLVFDSDEYCIKEYYREEMEIRVWENKKKIADDNDYEYRAWLEEREVERQDYERQMDARSDALYEEQRRMGEID